MPKSRYTLFTYNENGKQVTSAVHIYDIGSFLKEHPDAKRR